MPKYALPVGAENRAVLTLDGLCKVILECWGPTTQSSSSLGLGVRHKMSGQLQAGHIPQADHPGVVVAPAPKPAPVVSCSHSQQSLTPILSQELGISSRCAGHRVISQKPDAAVNGSAF